MVTFDICKGNPGALTFVMLAYEYNPYRAEAAFRRMQNNGITGDKLYMLWNDCCDRDVEQALVNMECMSMEEIVSHINYEGGRGIPIPKKENLWWLRGRRSGGCFREGRRPPVPQRRVRRHQRQGAGQVGPQHLDP